MSEKTTAAGPSAARQRAPRREGRRAQLTVPAHAWNRARELAAEQGTTPNDVLAQLVLRGLELVERERSVQSIATSRVDAYRVRRGAGADAGPLPAVEDAEEQARALRRDLAGDA